ncbi:MAG TPA: hypothetical protein PK156_25565 [Polyangium sp.]|nr:hypothetical protein [Polyangium sp.]
MLPRGDCDVALSRGALREGVAALEAFGDLLGSRRVGPRALDRAKSDTSEACQALLQALDPFEQTLLVSLGQTPNLTATMQALGERLRAHVGPMAEALRDTAPISARRRLALEAVFRKHRSGFKDCVALCDLAVAAVTAMPLDLEVIELFDSLSGDRFGDVSLVQIGIDIVRPVVMRADRHVLMGLVEAAVSFVGRSGTTTARLVAGTNDDGATVIRVGPAPRGWTLPKRTVSMPLRGEVELAMDVARAVALRSDLGVSFDAATNSASIVANTRVGPC